MGDKIIINKIKHKKETMKNKNNIKIIINKIKQYHSILRDESFRYSFLVLKR